MAEDCTQYNSVYNYDIYRVQGYLSFQYSYLNQKKFFFNRFIICFIVVSELSSHDNGRIILNSYYTQKASFIHCSVFYLKVKINFLVWFQAHARNLTMACVCLLVSDVKFNCMGCSFNNRHFVFMVCFVHNCYLLLIFSDIFNFWLTSNDFVCPIILKTFG